MEFLTTAEVAALLRLKERKVYEMVRRREIPCARVTGKWLFPRDLIESWIRASTEFGAGVETLSPPPPVIAGSHDPLLAWAAQESRSGLATLFEGSEPGLDRFAAGEAVIAGLHLRDPDSGDYNLPWVHARFHGRPVVVLTWAWREQGLIHAPDAPAAHRALKSLLAEGGRVAVRQTGSGSRALFDQLVREVGVEPAGLGDRLLTVRSETELAHTVAERRADAAFGVAAATAHTALAFTPLARERFDLILHRRDFFEPPCQRLFAFTRGEVFEQRAAKLPGYDVSELGAVVWNG